MPDRSDEFRKAAADCLALARNTVDPVTRTNLLTMAQKWFKLANGPATDFDAILRQFNDQQMTTLPAAPPGETAQPVMQQQQQVQPKKDEQA